MNAPDSGGISLGERLRLIEEHGEQTLAQVSELLARDRADHVRLTAITDRLAAVEASVTWLWRSVIGAVIVAGVGFLLSR